MENRVHPTAQKLVDTVSAMLDGSDPNELLVDDVLKASGISRGSLYHHFGDFPGLIETTLLKRFSSNVDADAAALKQVASESISKEDYWNRIRELSYQTQLPARASIRAERARLIGLAISGGAFARALAQEQDRMTQGMADAISLAQQKGWVNQQISPQAISVFLQAYSLGRAVDDVADSQLKNDEWIHLIENVLTTFEA